LEHLPRNAHLIEWLKLIRDAKGGPYVHALQEGTRRMRDEMHTLGLPAPEYNVSPLATEVILRNDAERREAASGLVDLATTEFSNLYPITSGLPTGARDDRRHAVLSALADRLQANGWFIDSVRFGIVTAHRRGAARPAPEQIAKIVRIYPAYTFQVRDYHERPYLIVDATVVVQSVINAAQAIGEFGVSQIAGLQGMANWRGWQRARILSADSEFCSQEETVASVKVIPRLPRALIDRAIAACGARYDLPREIKQAALALETNAARTRAERTQALVEELAETTFPIPVRDEHHGVAASAHPIATR